MAFPVGKGTVFNLEVSTVLTAIGQIETIDLPTAEPESFEADTLDNTDEGIPKKPTGRVDFGSFNLNGFLDPALSSFQILTDRVNAPSTPEGGSIVFADSGTTTWTFETSKVSVGGSVPINGGVRFTSSVEIDGSITFPT